MNMNMSDEIMSDEELAEIKASVPRFERSNHSALVNKPTDSKAQFWAMLDAMPPAVQGYWNRERDECEIGLLNNDLGRLSSGEALAARVLASIWFGNAYRLSNGRGLIDFTDLALLDYRARVALAEFLKAPFWP